MEEFKIGDYVVRLNNNHLGIKVGEVRKIYDINTTINQPKLEGQDTKKGSHAPTNLRIALPHEIPNNELIIEIW